MQTTVLAYEHQHGNMSLAANVTEQDGKECSNLLVLISELYNFQVISSVLVFDIIRALLNGDLTEFNVELLLKIVRSELYPLNVNNCCFIRRSSKIPGTN